MEFSDLSKQPDLKDEAVVTFPIVVRSHPRHEQEEDPDYDPDAEPEESETGEEQLFIGDCSVISGNRDVEAFNSILRAECGSWLLEAFLSGDPSPLELTEERPLEVHIACVVNGFPPMERAVFGHSLVAALALWDADYEGSDEALMGLARVAALTRTSEAASMIIENVESVTFDLTQDADVFMLRSIHSSLVPVGGELVEEYFSRFVVDEESVPMLGETMEQLIRLDPGRLPWCIQVVQAWDEVEPGVVDAEIVLSQLQRVVGEERMRAAAHDADVQAQGQEATLAVPTTVWMDGVLGKLV